MHFHVFLEFMFPTIGISPFLDLFKDQVCVFVPLRILFDVLSLVFHPFTGVVVIFIIIERIVVVNTFGKRGIITGWWVVWCGGDRPFKPPRTGGPQKKTVPFSLKEVPRILRGRGPQSVSEPTPEGVPAARSLSQLGPESSSSLRRSPDITEEIPGIGECPGPFFMTATVWTVWTVNVPPHTTAGYYFLPNHEKTGLGCNFLNSLLMEFAFLWNSRSCILPSL